MRDNAVSAINNLSRNLKAVVVVATTSRTVTTVNTEQVIDKRDMYIYVFAIFSVDESNRFP